MKMNRYFIAALASLLIAGPVLADDVTTFPQQVVTQTALVNINVASVNDLLKVKGINASKARAIVSYRKKNGSFKSLDELSGVKGFIRIKSTDLKNIQDQLTI